MFELIAGVFTGGGSTIVSSIFGSLSGLIGHWFKAKEDAEKRNHELKMRDMDMKYSKQESELAILEIKANLEVEKVVTEGNLQLEEAKGFNASIEAITTSKTLDTKVFMLLMNGGAVQVFFGSILAFFMGLVDIIRGSIRPLLTAASFGIMIYLVKVFAVEEGLMEADKVLILTLVIDASVYTLTAAVQFWFMSRSLSRDFSKKHIA